MGTLDEAVSVEEMNPLVGESGGSVDGQELQHPGRTIPGLFLEFTSGA